MDNLIVFDEKLSTYNFYNDILGKFLEIYKSQVDVQPVLDLRGTKYISPAAIPVLLSFGDYLRKLYKHPIDILVKEDSDLLNFMICSRFVSICKQLHIFNFDETVLESWRYKELRDLHKISFTNTKYADADKIEDLVQRRNFIFDCLFDRTKVIYENILSDTNQLPKSVIDTTISSIAEIETNAIIYSQSYSFTYVASDRFGTNISVADSGIGFEKSFEKAGRELFTLVGSDNIDLKFRNYLVIMNALNYSYQKHLKEEREDLWSLKNNVVNNNGILKIQYRNTQVIFSCNRCKYCTKNENKKDISACVKCLLERYSEDSYSPIKLFNVGFQGVRIEITINRGE
ncbi:MAG: hypothetical protein J6K15_03780 [Lachnospiraceae bacterium]|nr:hypothetical protein [Lachnospiraceae bacterium]